MSKYKIRLILFAVLTAFMWCITAFTFTTTLWPIGFYLALQCWMSSTDVLRDFKQWKDLP